MLCVWWCPVPKPVRRVPGPATGVYRYSIQGVRHPQGRSEGKNLIWPMAENFCDARENVAPIYIDFWVQMYAQER